ncbi:hypothetical protein DPX84_17940 [Salmonella enterica]|uniref:Uncharacterized protein n=3 Tax=Salmonella enterica TaxID=28901 RepID=A9MLW1_SALAR|nr:hypothetical protein SARI_00910 [Salmonella enterica subsp. arizonae serovar 62:z4,z23:-]EAA5371063.1 hypothetical protein [Salmonella enterica subsp. arizonae]EAN3421858.1 hypothetical protein [Salmonella enterica]EAO9511397.1 hypothetical protein [Salmonella enterica]EAU0103823.1 hypothetical protein [Salmonella enterica]
MRGKAVEATILKAGKAAGAPVPDMLSFLRGGVVSGHVIASGDRHDHDATGLKKFENVSSPERYKQSINQPLSIVKIDQYKYIDLLYQLIDGDGVRRFTG